MLIQFIHVHGSMALDHIFFYYVYVIQYCFYMINLFSKVYIAQSLHQSDECLKSANQHIWPLFSYVNSTADIVVVETARITFILEGSQCTLNDKLQGLTRHFQKAYSILISDG